MVLKCSFHLLACSSCDFIGFPFASFIGSFCIVFPESSLTIRYNVLESPCLAAVSASATLLPNHISLSALHRLFTSRSFALYAAMDSSLPTFVLNACSFFAFKLLRSSVAAHVPSLIHCSFLDPLLKPITSCAVLITVSLIIFHSSSTSISVFSCCSSAEKRLFSCIRKSELFLYWFFA